MKNKENDNPSAVVLGRSVNALGTIRSLNALKIPVISVGSSSGHKDIHNWMSSKTLLSEKIFVDDVKEDEKLLDCLIRLGNKLDKKGVIFPSGDQQVLCISRNRKYLDKYYHFLLPEDEQVRLLNDKSLFYKYAQENGIDIPETYFPKDVNEVSKIMYSLRFPVIVKAFFRDYKWQVNFGDKKVLIANNAEELLREFKKALLCCKEIMIQEVIPGQDNKLFFSMTFFDKQSRPLTMFTGRKLRQLPIKFGTSSMAESIWNSRVAELTIAILHKLRFVGYGSIEFKYDERDKKYKAMEITAGRTWYPHALATASGINIPALWYNYLTGKKTQDNNHFEEGIKWIDEYRDLIACYRYWKEKDISLLSILESYRGKKAYALASVIDPLPFIFIILRFGIGGLKNLIKPFSKLFIYFMRRVT